MQQDLTLKYHISFEIITSNGNINTLCNLSKKQNKILNVQGNYVLKNLRGLTIEQKDKKLYRRIEDQRAKSLI